MQQLRLILSFLILFALIHPAMAGWDGNADIKSRSFGNSSHRWGNNNHSMTDDAIHMRAAFRNASESRRNQQQKRVKPIGLWKRNQEGDKDAGFNEYSAQVFQFSSWCSWGSFGSLHMHAYTYSTLDCYTRDPDDFLIVPRARRRKNELGSNDMNRQRRIHLIQLVIPLISGMITCQQAPRDMGKAKN